MQQNPLLIDVVRGDRVVEQRRFEPGRRRPLKIGALPSADICVPGVARIHAVLSAAGNEVALVAMDRRVGVIHNGVCTQRAVINDGDQISIGEATRLLIRSVVEADQLPVGVPPGCARPAVTAPPAANQPRFDPGAGAGSDTQRITREQVGRPAVASRPHPALLPEAPVSLGHRALELRTYLGQALLDIHHYVDEPRITIGEHKKADVFLSSEGLPAELFPLVRLQEDDTYVLTFTSAMEGEVEIDGELWTLAQLCQRRHVAADPDLAHCFRLRLSLNTRVLLHWGGVSFALRFVAPPGLLADRFEGVDHHYLKTLALALAMVSTAVLTMLVQPIYVRARTPQRIDSGVTLHPPVSMQPFRPPEPEPPEPSAARQREPRHASDSSSLRAPRDRAGAATEIRGRIRGFLGAAGGLLAGSSLPSLGLDTRIIGSRGRYATGPGPASEARSLGPSLGGIGRRRGVGPIVTRPCLAGTGCAGLRALGSPRRGSRTEIGVFQIEDPVVEEASLSKDLIRAVINKSRGQIRACYERELQRDHDLAGKVAVRWIIAATGRVVRVVIVENAMGNREVARCISERIRQWQFPPPAGGGVVEVNYPFLFHAI